MNSDTLTKENILKVLDVHHAFNYYLQSYHNKGTLKQGKHISNPFLPHKQKTPSFNIYKTEMGSWRFKDFATGDEGSIFDLVMKLKQCDFREALMCINQDFSLNLTAGTLEPDWDMQLKPTWDSTDLQY